MDVVDKRSDGKGFRVDFPTTDWLILNEGRDGFEFDRVTSLGVV